MEGINLSSQGFVVVVGNGCFLARSPSVFKRTLCVVMALKGGGISVHVIHHIRTTDATDLHSADLKDSLREGSPRA